MSGTAMTTSVCSAATITVIAVALGIMLVTVTMMNVSTMSAAELASAMVTVMMMMMTMTTTMMMMLGLISSMGACALGMAWVTMHSSILVMVLTSVMDGMMMKSVTMSMTTEVKAALVMMTDVALAEPSPLAVTMVPYMTTMMAAVLNTVMPDVTSLTMDGLVTMTVVVAAILVGTSLMILMMQSAASSAGKYSRPTPPAAASTDLTDTAVPLVTPSLAGVATAKLPQSLPLPSARELAARTPGVGSFLGMFPWLLTRSPILQPPFTLVVLVVPAVFAAAVMCHLASSPMVMPPTVMDTPLAAAYKPFLL